MCVRRLSFCYMATRNNKPRIRGLRNHRSRLLGRIEQRLAHEARCDPQDRRTCPGQPRSGSHPFIKAFDTRIGLSMTWYARLAQEPTS